VAQTGAAGSVQVQSARREVPAKSGGGGVGRVIGAVFVLLILAAAGVGGAVATGVIDLGIDIGGDGDDVEPSPAVTVDADDGLLKGGIVEVAELTAERGTARLVLRPPDQATLDLRAVGGDYKVGWDGSGKLELVGLEAGLYKTKVKPKAGGGASRATLEIEPGSNCTYSFDLNQAEEWQKDCGE
jgi:hypothetical protein